MVSELPPASEMPYDADSLTVTSLTAESLDVSSRMPAPPWRRIVNPCTVTAWSLRTRNPYCRTVASRASPAVGAGPPRSTYKVRVAVSKNQLSVTVPTALGA